MYERIVDDILSFSRTVHRCIMHSTQSNCYSANSQLPFSWPTTP